MHNTIAVAMSGGVDSSVAVWLLRQEGWETAGVTLRLFQPEDLAPGRGEACHALQDAEDARAVAAQLGIPHYTPGPVGPLCPMRHGPLRGGV